MTNDPDRAPCPECGELTPVAGRICSYCRGSLLVDVIVQSRPADERSAYRVARQLKNRWAELDFLEAKRGLEAPNGTVVAAATRDQAREVTRILSNGGLTSRIHHRQTEIESTGLNSAFKKGTRLAILSAVVAIFALLVLSSLRRSDTVPSRLPAKSEQDPATPGPSVDSNSPVEVSLVSSKTPDEGVMSAREISEKFLASTVTVYCPEGEGSGFFVARDLIVTSLHVVCDELEIEVVGGNRFEGNLFFQDQALDVAIVRIPEEIGSPLTLGDATQLQQGDPVTVIGNPYGMEMTLTQGIVSHAVRNVLGVHYLQVDANINPGNSGGPLFDSRGRVAGIVSMSVGPDTGLGLALPINYLYEPPNAQLERPRWVDSSVWRGRQRVIQLKDLEEVANFENSFSRPRVQAALVGQESIFISVLVFQQAKPVEQDLRFDFYKQGRYLCSGQGTVGQWEEISEGYIQNLDRRTRDWFEKNGLLPYVWAGVTRIWAPKQCSLLELVGAEIWINGAEPAPTQHTLVRSQ